MTFNGLGTSIYDSLLETVRNGAYAQGELPAGTYFQAGEAAAATSAAGTFDTICIDIPDYANAVANKVWRGEYTRKPAAATLNLYRGRSVGWLRSNVAVNRITIPPSTGAWAQYSKARLLGYY